QAIALCFDFEWTNRNLFFEAYQRSQSLFERSDYKARGAPSPEELELLSQYRDDIPEEAFGEAVLQPVSDGSGRDRTLLLKASDLLAEAGWTRPVPPSLWQRVLDHVGLAGELPDPQFLLNESGERLKLEILALDETF